MRILVVLLVLSLAAGAQPIKVGILHSKTGIMATTESPLIDAALLAIKEINLSGGVLGGRKLEAVVRDGASDPAVFAREARRLITEDRVSALFGTWTSDSRRAVLPVLAQSNHLLFYGVQYEGGETDRHVIYTGLTANQQLFPALRYLGDTHGGRAFMVGSESFFSRAIHEEARRGLSHHGGQLVGEVYRPMGPGDYSAVVDEIARAQPDFILLTQNLEATESFFEAYARRGLKVPVISLSMGEIEVQKMRTRPVGHYVCRGYFATLDSPSSRRFVALFREAYGSDRAVDDNVQSAYFQIKAYARAVEGAGSLDPGRVRAAARGLILDTPGGLVRIDPATQHTWRTCRIGQVKSDGRIEVVWSSELPVKPKP